MKNQNYANHRRFMPMYHYVLTALILLAVGGSIYNIYRAWARDSGRGEALLVFLLVVIAVIEGGLLRTFALKAQDRAIRAEENLRHYVLYGSLLDPKLNIRQIIGLRFAADEEFGPLAEQAAKEGMSEIKIKRAVKEWRADHDRL